MDQNSFVEWYHQLNKPSWAPNENTIGLVWSILYPIIIAVNIYVIVRVVKHTIPIRVAIPFWINAVVNILFTPIQFGLRNNLLASIDAVLILVTIVWAMIAIWQYSKYASLAYVPYLVWVSIATVLQISITLMNR